MYLDSCYAQMLLIDKAKIELFIDLDRSYEGVSEITRLAGEIEEAARRIARDFE